MIRSGNRAALLAASGLTVAIPGIGWAQPALNNAPSEEIIVTARKRDETSISVPVVLTAVSGAQLERRGIIKLDDLTKLVPQLNMGPNGGSPQGGIILIRGIAGGENNPFADQAVAFNVDGVQVSRAQIRRLAEMDLGQIEVLKGPQALFFGKNSPAGVISIRSADPTSSFQAKAAVGYEFNAREWRGDGFISGPISDTLGARVAVFGTTMRGWFRNEANRAPPFNAVAAQYYPLTHNREPKTKEVAIRGTLKWEPSDRFDARLKLSYDRLEDSGALNTGELYSCPFGAPQLGGPDDCKANGKAVRLALSPYLATLSNRLPANGKPYLNQKQVLMSYEMNYDITDELDLTSVTGYYYLRQDFAENYNSAVNPAQILSSGNVVGNNEFSEELRLRSSFEGPVNFLVGGFFQKTKAFSGNTTFVGLERVNGVNPNQLNDYLLKQRGSAYSVFGQVSLKPTTQLEFTAGARYSYERKRLPFVASQGSFVNGAFVQAGAAPAPLMRVIVPPDPRFPRKDSWTNLSPEFTVAYRPTDRLTLFGSYKQGFLSGGFNGGVNSFNADLRFDQQVIKGFEGGVKAALFNRALRLNLAAYRYIITGLQITTSVTTAAGSTSNVLNAGKVIVKGLEGDFNFRMPGTGLSLHGGAGYNNAKYHIFSVNCWVGQTQQEGCNFGVPTSAVISGQTFTTFPLQDLAGQQLLRAPKWSGNLGASFEHDIGSNLRFSLDGDMNFSSSYFTNVSNNPHSRQKPFQMFDVSARIGAQNGQWELALIGQNLTNEFYALRVNDHLFTGVGQGRSANDPRGRVLSDQFGFSNRGRQIMLQGTIRYGGR